MIGVGDHRQHKESTEVHLPTSWYDQYHGVGIFCLQIRLPRTACGSQLTATTCVRWSFGSNVRVCDRK